MSIKIIKIIVSGDGGVGKSTLLHKYIDNKFISSKLTRGIEFFSKKIKIEDKDYKLVLWDLGGQKHFKKIFYMDKVLKGAMGALILFDLSRFSTLLNIDFWLDFLKICGKIPILIIGSKSDRISNTENIDDFVSEVLKENDNCFDYLKTSSVTGENVIVSFETIVRKSLNKC